MIFPMMTAMKQTRALTEADRVMKTMDGLRFREKMKAPVKMKEKKGETPMKTKTAMEMMKDRTAAGMMAPEEAGAKAARIFGMKAMSIIMRLNSSRAMRIRLPMKAGSEI